ncbi:uncharacterized protein LOC134251177 [Saccostrea cucullata]|uniref:uncharacterized protein LOC134251177 n=1 Tax=Saccostrea cuccullata TaxID=36930 RepID=UPI002ED1BE62
MAWTALPKTKDQLKEKNLKLRKELDDLRRQYEVNVYSVIENLKTQYYRTKLDPCRYERLKESIKEATSDENLEQTDVVPGKDISEPVVGFVESSRELAERMKRSAQHEREISNMQKTEIEVQIEDLNRHIQRYDSRFKRAHNKLRALRREYGDSKRHLPPERYRLLKRMIKTVIKDSELTPD